MEVNGIVGYVTESANISWTVPTNFTCPHKYIFESIEKPNMTSPAGFMLGKHKIPYIYTLYGGKKVTCNVEVNVRYVGKWTPRLLESKVSNNIESTSNKWNT